MKSRLAALDSVGGRFVLEVKLEVFSSGIDESELGVGVRGLFDEFGHRSLDPASVAVANEKDLLRRGSCGEN